MDKILNLKCYIIYYGMRTDQCETNDAIVAGNDAVLMELCLVL